MSFLVGAGKGERDLNVTTSETKFVPTLEHARAIRHPVRRSVINPDVKGTIGGIDLTRIVPLNIGSAQIPKIDCLPKGIIARFKRTAIKVELIGEDKIIGIAIVTSATPGGLGSVRINE